VVLKSNIAAGSMNVVFLFIEGRLQK